MEHSNLQKKSHKGNLNLASRSLEFTQIKPDKYILTALFIRVTVYSLNPLPLFKFCAKSLAFFIRPEAEQFAGARVSGRRGARRRRRRGGGALGDQSAPAGLSGLAQDGPGWPSHGSGELGLPRPWRRPRTTGSCSGEATRKWRWTAQA